MSLKSFTTPFFLLILPFLFLFYKHYSFYNFFIFLSL
jgi:hypothetical protein